MIDVVDQELTSDDWCTSADLAADLGSFDLDPASNPRSHIRAKRSLMLERGDNGLVASWSGSVYLNFPYSDPLPWCLRLAAHDGPWVALVKTDPSTRWWAALMSANPQWAPFRARLRFEMPGKKPMTANFSSSLVWSCWRMPAAIAARLWIPTYGGKGQP